MACMVLWMSTLTNCRSRGMKICWVKDTRHPLSRLGWVWQATWTRLDDTYYRMSSWLSRIGSRLIRITSWLARISCCLTWVPMWLNGVPNRLAWISNLEPSSLIGLSPVRSSLTKMALMSTSQRPRLT